MKRFIVIIALLFSVQGFSQTQTTDEKFYSKQDNVVVWVGLGGFADSFAEGTFLSGSGAFTQGLDGKTYFGEFFRISSYEYEGTDKMNKGGSGDGNELEFGLRLERIGGTQKLNSFQLSGGVRFLEQNSNFANKPTEQQNHVLGFASIQWDINRKRQNFSRFVFGGRLDVPIRATFERIEGTKTTTGKGSNLRSFSFWTEIGIHSFYLGKTEMLSMSDVAQSWALTGSLTMNYTGRSEAPSAIVSNVKNGTTSHKVVLDATKNVEVGAVLGLWKGRSELLRIGFSYDMTLGSNSSSLEPKQVWYVAGDVWNGVLKPVFNLVF